jgi:hypothetical protein
VGLVVSCLWFVVVMYVMSTIASYLSLVTYPYDGILVSCLVGHCQLVIYVTFLIITHLTTTMEYCYVGILFYIITLHFVTWIAYLKHIMNEEVLIATKVRPLNCQLYPKCC